MVAEAPLTDVVAMYSCWPHLVKLIVSLLLLQLLLTSVRLLPAQQLRLRVLLLLAGWVQLQWVAVGLRQEAALMELGQRPEGFCLLRY
jgi:hypothetical protein